MNIKLKCVTNEHWILHSPPSKTRHLDRKRFLCCEAETTIQIDCDVKGLLEWGCFAILGRLKNTVHAAVENLCSTSSSATTMQQLYILRGRLSVCIALEDN